MIHNLMNQYISLTIVAVLVFPACQTVDFPEPTATGSDTPQFLFEGSAGGEPINWAAGESNYYMHTDYAKDPNGVYSFVGQLKQEGCNDPCPNSLSLRIKDVAVATSVSAVNINEALKVGTLNYTNEKVEDSIRINFRDNQLHREHFEYSFMIGDQVIPDPIKNDASLITIPRFGKDALLSITGKHQDNLFEYSLTQPIYPIGDRRKRLKVMVKTNGRKFQVVLIPTPENQVESINWNNNTNNKREIVLEELPTTRNLKAEVKYSDGKITTFSIHFKEGISFAQLANVDFTFSLDFIPKVIEAGNVKQFRTSEIIYYDSSGKQYSSLKARQSVTSVFRISESESFNQNGNGDKTRKIKFEINTHLGNADGEIIEFVGAGIFALAYPG